MLGARHTITSSLAYPGLTAKSLWEPPDAGAGSGGDADDSASDSPSAASGAARGSPAAAKGPVRMASPDQVGRGQQQCTGIGGDGNLGIGERSRGLATTVVEGGLPAVVIRVPCTAGQAGLLATHRARHSALSTNEKRADDPSHLGTKNACTLQFIQIV